MAFLPIFPQGLLARPALSRAHLVLANLPRKLQKLAPARARPRDGIGEGLPERASLRLIG
jgi:hypothetical protein